MDFITTYSEFMLNEKLKTHDINLTYDNVNRELSLLRFNFSINTKSNKIGMVWILNSMRIQTTEIAQPHGLSKIYLLVT